MSERGERPFPIRLAKPAVFLLALLPALLLLHDALYGAIAANPYRPLVRETGYWSLRFLVVGLSLTPLSALLGLGWLGAFRRMIGLYAAFYALLHLVVWAMDYDFDWGFLAGEVVERAYLAVGLVAAVLLVPLASTSTKGWVKRLGGRSWRALHRLVYPAAVLAWLHYELVGRLYQPELYVTALALALALAWRGWRAGFRWQRAETVLR